MYQKPIRPSVTNVTPDFSSFGYLDRRSHDSFCFPLCCRHWSCEKTDWSVGLYWQFYKNYQVIEEMRCYKDPYQLNCTNVFWKDVFNALGRAQWFPYLKIGNPGVKKNGGGMIGSRDIQKYCHFPVKPATVDGRNPAITTWFAWNPVNSGTTTISTGAGFVPSTVCRGNSLKPEDSIWYTFQI